MARRHPVSCHLHHPPFHSVFHLHPGAAASCHLVMGFLHRRSLELHRSRRHRALLPPISASQCRWSLAHGYAQAHRLCSSFSVDRRCHTIPGWVAGRRLSVPLDERQGVGTIDRGYRFDLSVPSLGHAGSKISNGAESNLRGTKSGSNRFGSGLRCW